MLETVLKVVEAEFGVSRAQLLCSTRCSPEVAWARQIVMWLMWIEQNNFTQIGLQLQRDRTTVSHGVKKVRRLLSDQQADKLVTDVRAIAPV